MSEFNPAALLQALSQPHRLTLFEAIAKSEVGLTSSEAAKASGMMLNSATAKLAVLESAGLISPVKKWRAVTHSANLGVVGQLAKYLEGIGS